MSDKPVSHRVVELAAITGAHGISGEVRLKLFGEGVAALKRYRAFLMSGDGSALNLKKIRDDGKGGAVARFEGVDNRNAAEKMRGTVLTVSREDMPELDEGEYYHADLIGLPVVTDSGESVGEVQSVENFGATDVLEIKKVPTPEKGLKSFMVPMTEQAVIEWDESRLVVNADFVDN